MFCKNCEEYVEGDYITCTRKHIFLSLYIYMDEQFTF